MYFAIVVMTIFCYCSNDWVSESMHNCSQKIEMDKDSTPD